MILFKKRITKALIRLRVCAGWSEPLLVAHTTLLEISYRGSYVCVCKRTVSRRRPYSLNPLCPKFISNKRVFRKIGGSNFRGFTVVTLQLHGSFGTHFFQFDRFSESLLVATR